MVQRGSRVLSLCPERDPDLQDFPHRELDGEGELFFFFLLHEARPRAPRAYFRQKESVDHLTAREPRRIIIEKYSDFYKGGHFREDNIGSRRNESFSRYVVRVVLVNFGFGFTS